MNNEISLNGLNKAEVLAVLYNASKPQGMGMLAYDPKPMTKEEAENILQKTTYFDYLKGRVMKISLNGDVLNSSGYNMDNGQGAAEKIIELLRQTGETHTAEIQNLHVKNTRDSIDDLKTHINDDSLSNGNVLHMGFKSVANALKPAMESVSKQL